jgi:hypothetical protein
MIKLFESKYKRRIIAEKLRLEALWWALNDKKKATNQSLNPKDYASVWMQQKELQSKINMLKILIQD